MTTQYHLLKTRRFLPLFITQFLNAFNDNVFKNALVVLITYKIAQTASSEQLMIALTGGIFILPFFLLSATAGQVADKLEKSMLIRIIKFLEIVFMVVGSLGFYFSNLPLLMTTLFFLGTHSTFFGPLKYSILPTHLHRDELVGGNGLIEAGTFVAILIGQILSASLILHNNGIRYITIALISIAVLGLVSSFFIPKASPGQPNLKISFNIFTETWKLLTIARQKKAIFSAILGISWFWFVGATLLTQFPTFTKNILHSQASIFTLFLTTFSLGIGVGSLLCNRLLKGRFSTKYVPMAVIGMSIFLIDLYFASIDASNPSNHLLSLTEFLSNANNIRIVLDVFLLTVCSGLFIVPLYVLLQEKSAIEVRSRVIAANNIVNALFMVGSALFVAIFTLLNFSISQLFLIVAIINLLVAIYICKLLPDAIIQSFVKTSLRLVYRVEIKGLDNYYQAGSRLLIIANHTSYLDAVLLAAFIPKRLTFAINTHMAKKWWLRPIASIVDIIPLDPSNPMALKKLIKKIRDNKQCVIFPEGRLTVTGSLMKVYEGPGIVADQANAAFLPVRIDGAQFSRLSRLDNKMPLKWFPKITLTVLPHQHFNMTHEIKGRLRRQILGRKLYDLMSNMIFETSDYHKPLFKSLLEAKKVHSDVHEILEDVQRKPMNYAALVKACFVLGKQFQLLFSNQKNIGLLLPNTISNVISFFALQAINKTPAMLNYTFGDKNLLSCCESAGIKNILTSKQFIEAAKLEKNISSLANQSIAIHYLEDIKSNIKLITKMHGLIQYAFPNWCYRGTLNPDDPAVILFTSGSEGSPKGVVLSHKNIQANRFQLSAKIDFTSQDIIFNALPMFHAFGLNAGTLLPVLFGMKTFLYPSPLHYRMVPEYIYDVNATVTFGTDTFLRGYARFGNAYDFYSIRYVLAGAEKLKDETKQLWIEKFGIRILEGYGATETSPVLSVNTPMHYRSNSAGRLLPGIETYVEPVPGISEGGRLHVKGPNIMLGYLFATSPEKIQPPTDGWYDTGDIVNIDEQGFISLIGRAKRFAKIAGEMVSLSAIEEVAYTLWPNFQHAAISINDAVKGEQIILFTNNPEGDRSILFKFAKENGISEIQIPKKVIVMEKLPLLGTGKIDYECLRNLPDSLTRVAPL